jgi:hypothetical protein
MSSSARKVERISESILTSPNSIQFSARMDERFPAVDPMMKPYGDLALFQIRRPNKFTLSGLEIASDARAVEYYNTQIAKVLALGNLTFKTVRNVDGQEKIFDWPEGQWFKVGDFVCVPRYGGDRYTLKATVTEVRKLIGQKEETTFEITEDIVFAFFKVRDVQGVVLGDPCSIGAFHD